MNLKDEESLLLPGKDEDKLLKYLYIGKGKEQQRQFINSHLL